MRAVRLLLLVFAVAAMATGTALALSPSWSRYLPSFMRSDAPSGDVAEPGPSAGPGILTPAPGGGEVGGAPPGTDEHRRGGGRASRTGANDPGAPGDGTSATGDDPGLRRGDELGRANTPDGERDTGRRDPPPPAAPAPTPPQRLSERGRSLPDATDGSSQRDGPADRAHTDRRDT